MNKRYLFISDQHLGLQTKEIEDKKERLLVKFLEFAEDNCDELFLVGDLFDYWFEYKRVYQKGFFRTLTALKDVAEKGIKIELIPEKYTSKCSFLDNEFPEKRQNYAGRRITRGLFRSAQGFLINADVNAAYNI